MEFALIPRFICSGSAVALLAALTLGALEPRARAVVLIAPTVTDSATPFGPTYDAANTVDQTELDYASQGLGIDTFIEYTFAPPQTFDRIVVINRDSPGQSDLIGDFTLTFDGGPNTVPVSRMPVRGVSELHSLSAPRTATTVRLDVDTVGLGFDPDDNFNNTGAMEVIFVRTPAGQFPISGVSIFDAAAAFAPLYSADNAVDGDIGRSTDAAAVNGPEYASNRLGTNTFVDFNLGAVTPVGGFDFFDRPADEDRVTGFDMIFSINSTFGDLDDVLRSYTNPNLMALSDEFAPIFAQYVRFDVTAHNPFSPNTGISEMIFYQVPEPASGGLLAMGMAALLMRRRR